MNFKETLIKKKKDLLINLKTKEDLEFLSEARSKKKIKWADENLPLLEEKYSNLSHVEKAFNIIYIDHLNSNKGDFELTYITPNKLQILSRNFCPYLESCKDLNLDTREICKLTGEKPFQDLASKIDKNLKFYRNYEKIRPYCDYCEEYLEFIPQSENLNK